MNILVDGGTGFVGHWLHKAQPKNIKATYLNRADYNMSNWRHEWDAIVHLANISPDLVISLKPKRLLYCSSGIVYHPENDIEYRQNKIRWEHECLDSGLDVVIARLFTFFGDKLDNGKAWAQFNKAAKANQPPTSRTRILLNV